MSIDPAENTGQFLCPQCGTAVPAAASIPPTPVLPPPPVAQTMQPGDILPYSELQQAAIYCGMARTLRGIGIGNILWGIVIILFGVTNAMSALSGVSVTTTIGLVFGVAYIFFGVVFIAEGIWLIAAPSASGLLVAAFTMFVSCVLFIAGPLLIIVLVLFGLSLIRRYQKYGPLMAERPAPAMMAQAGELLNRLRKAARKRTLELIEFNSAGAFVRRMWRGLLQDNLVVLIAYEKRFFGMAIEDIYFLSPEEISIDVKGKVLIGKMLKGTLMVQGKQFTGTIPPVCYDRYEVWNRRYTLSLQ